MNTSHIRRIKSTIVHSRRGVASMVALVTLAVVASAVMLFAQTITRELRHDAAAWERIQQEILEQDMRRVSETDEVTNEP